MRDAIQSATLISALAAFVVAAAPVFAQTSTAPDQTVAAVRHLSIDEAVNLALEQNLGIQIERMNPRIQDIAIAQARSFWAPNLTSTLSTNSQNNPATSALSGGQSKITDSRFSTQIGLNQILPTGANYSVGWNSFRSEERRVGKECRSRWWREH